MSPEMRMVSVWARIRRQTRVMTSRAQTGLHGQSGQSAQQRVEGEVRRGAEIVWRSGMVDPTVTARETARRWRSVTLRGVLTSPPGQSGAPAPSLVEEE